MTQVKICGITRMEDARAAAACGADAVGFIFHPQSPRCVSPAQAAAISASLPGGIAKVGVFVNLPAEEVRRIASFCRLDFIQLHGDEPPEYCRLFPAGKVIKAVSPRREEDLTALEAYAVRAFLVDARQEGLYGGTGSPADWELAGRLAERHPLILAGGLGPANIAAALAAVDPAAADINSGCEQAPGIKDHGLMRTVIELVRRFGTSGKGGVF